MCPMILQRISIIILMFIIIEPSYGQSMPTGKDVMYAVELRDVGRNERADIKMVLEDAKGRQRERRLIRLRQSKGRDEKVRIQFLFPPDIRETAFLMHDYPNRDDDRWLYLPSLRKVKRISGAQKYRNFLGTDFTYDELGGREPEEDTQEMEGEDTFEGRAVYRIRNVPKESANPYSYRLAWVWKEVPIILKEESYDRHGKLRKRMRVLDLKTVQGIYTVLKREMVDVQGKHRTEVTFSQVRYNTDLRPRLFQSSSLVRPIK